MQNISQTVCQLKLYTYPINHNILHFHCISQSQMPTTYVFGTVARNWICRKQIGALIVSLQCWHICIQTRFNAKLLKPHQPIDGIAHRNWLYFRCIPGNHSLSFLSPERTARKHHEHIARHTLQTEGVGKVSLNTLLPHSSKPWRLKIVNPSQESFASFS